jgi:hypothetical protein
MVHDLFPKTGFHFSGSCTSRVCMTAWMRRSRGLRRNSVKNIASNTHGCARDRTSRLMTIVPYLDLARSTSLRRIFRF